MAKYKVLKEFKNKETDEVYSKGQEITLTAKRAIEVEKNLESFGSDFLSKVEEDKKDNKDKKAK